MFVIRDTVWEQLGKAASADFVRRVRVHLKTFFPEQWNTLGEARTGQFIEAGIIRAREHGFVSERDICKYIDLMCIFGHRFDRDPKLPWAREILDSRFPPDPEERMDELYGAALDAMGPASAGEDEHDIE